MTDKYYRENVDRINKHRRIRWQKIKDDVNAKRRMKFQQEKEHIAHVVLNGVHKKIQLNREKSKTCDICHRKVNRRNAHHFSYDNPSEDWITVCTACHSVIHMTIWHNKYKGIFNSIDEWYEAYKKTIQDVV